MPRLRSFVRDQSELRSLIGTAVNGSAASDGRSDRAAVARAGKLALRMQ